MIESKLLESVSELFHQPAQNKRRPRSDRQTDIQVDECVARYPMVETKKKEENVRSAPNSFLSSEVREKILRTEVNNKRSDGTRLVERIVNEQTTCSNEEQRERGMH